MAFPGIVPQPIQCEYVGVTDRWQQVKQILHDASELPRESRKSFVIEASSGDDDIIAEVESLLESFDDASDFLEDAPIQLGGLGDSLEGRWIGDCRIESLIAKGGMGSVYLASKQMDGVPLRVAVKIIRFAGNLHYLNRRFRMERQILARLTHENIVRLLDGGVTQDGLPFIVTEYLDARNLEIWLNETQPTLSAKLKAFQALCDGVSYAHRNLIVHGDIKPSNILITRDEVPKLVDFGIARLMCAQEATDSGQNTITMAPALTPWWASPEQLQGAPLTIESDCYELGRILFFMLTGQKPHDFTGLTPQQILEKLRREPPPKPSTMTGDARMAGDLDNIVLKALEFDRGQRYRSVDALNEDISRHLAMRPISARAQTAGYRVEKFIRRNKGLVSVTTAATLALFLSVGFAVYQAGQARAGRETSRQRFEQIRNLANSLLEADNAMIGLSGATEVRSKLVRSALGYLDQLAKQDNQDPQLQEDLAAAYERVGDIQGRPGSTNLGQTAQSLESYRKSEAIREALRMKARQSPGFIGASDRLARTYARISASLRAAGDGEGALGYERKALGIRQALFEGDPDNLAFQRALATNLTTLSGSLSQQGDFAGVMETRREALKMHEEILARNPDSPTDLRGLALALARMGSIELHEGLFKESLEHYQRALEIDTRLLKRDPSDVQLRLNVGWAHNNYGVILHRLNRYPEAIEQFEIARPYFLEVSRADAKDFRSRTLLETNRVRQAHTLLAMGRHVEAMSLVDAALKGREFLADQNRSNAGAQGEVAETHTARGHIFRAMGQRRQALDEYNIARRMLEELIRSDRSNAAMKEDMAAVENALKGMGALGRTESFPAPNSN
jgi:tetratricopeptide (TPR) repeat protein